MVGPWSVKWQVERAGVMMFWCGVVTDSCDTRVASRAPTRMSAAVLFVPRIVTYQLVQEKKYETCVYDWVDEKVSDQRYASFCVGF